MIGALAAFAMLVLAGLVIGSGLGLRAPREAAPMVLGLALGFGAVWVLASLFRRHPARVCYVRAKGGHGGGRFIRELRPYGHVIAYRTAGGAGAVSPRALAPLLRNRFMLNLRALCSDQQTLTLDAAPALTRMLAQASDVVIVDLSDGAPPDWDAIQPEAARCVFVSAWGQHEQAEAALANLGANGQCFFYAPDGEIQRRAAFGGAVLEAMRAAHGARG
jgi:hypothetical protein